MLCDGLTKGVIARDALRTMASQGTWKIEQALELFMQPKKTSEYQKS